MSKCLPACMSMHQPVLLTPESSLQLPLTHFFNNKTILAIPHTKAAVRSPSSGTTGVIAFGFHVTYA